MERNTDSGHINGVMVVNIQEISSRTIFMAKESIFGTLKSTMDSGFIH